MKTNHYLLGFVLLLVGTMPAFSQVSNDNEDGVNKVDQRYVQGFVPGQVLVKFKDESSVGIQRARGKFKSSGISRVDNLLHNFGVREVEKVFPNEVAKPKARLRRIRAYDGSIVEEKNLDKIFWIKTNMESPDSTMQLIEELKAIPDVEYAEPNYFAYITAEMPSSYSNQQTNNNKRAVWGATRAETNAEVICSNPSQNPLYFRQYGITQQNIYKLWNKPIINKKRPVIAILDTGVDITHPDLADNIWTNTQELEGETAYDDDNNGIVDDEHGWNFVDNYYDLTDRNGHGTHVAGIAAAVDNNLGIVGANPLALIMPVKVMNDRGVGDIGTICRGIDYATENGANIINMSFGSSGLSNTMKDALDRAFQSSILVASAGNNGLPIYELMGTCYPAAYYLVLGVEASGSNLQRASFSNYDPDGPIYSEDGIDGRNYELMVPGDKIYSTLPNGKYNQLSGTSMSAPLLAGAISALQMVKEYPSKDVLFGDLIHLKADFDKIYSNDTPRMPKIDLASLNVDDNVEGNINIDGQVDVNETIRFYPVLRNTWADATDIKLTLTVDENYQSFVEIQNPQVDFGWSLSAYGRQTAKTPINVFFKENISDNTRIKFQLEVSYYESSECFTQDVYVTVHNRNYVSGIINSDMLLTADKIWYWEKFYLDENSTLTIEPGTKIVISSNNGQVIKGKIICEGTKDNHITFDYNGVQNTKGHIFTGTVNYCEFKNFHINHGTMLPGFCFDFANRDPETGRVYHTFDHCAFDIFSFDYNIYNGDDRYSMNHCMVYGIPGNISPYCDRFSIQNSNVLGNGISYNNSEEIPFISNSNIMYPYYNGSWGDVDNIILSYGINELGTLHLPNTIYYGTSNENVLRKHSLCYPEGGWGVIDYTNMQKVPFAEAPGIVWKVVVNGKDAQDEYEDLAPLGVGKHKFEVFFNRPMNKEKVPQITFGVREPYTQHKVDEDGSWNAEGTIYTIYKSITGRTQSDGVNRIFVQGAEDDEFFDCPYENSRFNINIQTAGSLATGFAAEAGLGRVELTWNNDENDFEDAMGFNIYRFGEPYEKQVYNPHSDAEGHWQEYETVMVADTICINKEIVDIQTTEYTDYDVTPGETYYYMYKVLSTDLQEYDVSNVVAATPLTSELGDANGDGDVDVSDVITTVNYAAGMEPKPFIYEAADMNKDLSIDILDVIGIIQKILNPATAEARVMAEATATYTIEDGVLYVESPVELAGVQVQIALNEKGEMGKEKLVAAEDLKGFEQASAWLTESDYLLLAYNMSGKTLTAGKHALLTIGDGELTTLRLSDAQGHQVVAVPGEATIVRDAMGSKVMNAKGVYNLNGQKVVNSQSPNDKLPKGVYIINGEKVVK